MLYLPQNLTANDTLLAKAVEVGAESLVKVSYNPFGIAYEIQQSGPDAADVNPVAGAYALPADGMELQLRAVNSVRSDAGAIAVTLDVTDEDDASTTAVATFAAPSFAADQTDNFNIGMGVDLVPATGADKKIKSIDGFNAITNGGQGNKFQVVALPQQSSWITVACTRSKDITLPFPSTIAIPCGFNGSQYVKAGRSEAGNLTVEAAYNIFGDGLTRLAGQQVTAMVESYREGRVLVERLVCGGWRCTPNSPKGDGDDETVTTAEGLFEEFAVFSAG